MTFLLRSDVIVLKGADFMLAVNYSTISKNLDNYCDKATDEYETVISIIS